LRVLGIDPGTHKMGVGVVNANGSDLEMVYVGVISPKRNDPISKRLAFLFDGLTEVMQEWRPTEVAIEEPFAGRNVKAAMAIGHAQAIAMLVAARFTLDVALYAPSQIKQAVTDHGGSSKEQVQEMVRILLNIDETPASSDAADALAIAICHINASQVEALDMRE
jgi:crossover junction endodeoxyribonuclease RuvC